jgi:hypothetical protein
MKVDINALAQQDLFNAIQENGSPVPKRQKKRDVQAEAISILAQSGISDLPKEVKEYVLAKLIALWFPELSNVMFLSLVSCMGMKAKEHQHEETRT